MNTVWVAYDAMGDLVASADTESELWQVLEDSGLDEYVVLAGRVTP